ncbi:unnamed protein product [Bursaphelenchus okinawaensis]|uniref:GDP-fucose protein O-fucosyltransferase 2 n=1 Tax=Bursaphelenchus okinawaensis TaxID=465554 RepID=A0A811KLK8_9BILA|nr:unnamed protein product [Bursaphelenchus okinawaensis]CAG9107444.1 unnamed protein product [Bursaphelenchus okinawaensis]
MFIKIDLKMKLLVSTIVLSIILFIKCHSEQDVTKNPKKYLIFGVNIGEGFNLRRDVYSRIANTVRQLRKKGHNYRLVLPPFHSLFHWRHKSKEQPFYKWAEFFDLEAMNQFVPVMELEDFIKENGPIADTVLYLQHYEEGWGENFEMKFDIRPCIDGNVYYTINEQTGRWLPYLSALLQIEFNKMKCLSIQGQSSTLTEAILKSEPESKNVLIDRSETILHDHFGDKFYWDARRSMRYAKKLVDIGDEFRRTHLNSTDQNDKTYLPSSWLEHEPKPGQAIGGPYLAVHWRRRDFIHAHSKKVPSVDGTVTQVVRKLKELDLDTVFICTDAEDGEYGSLREKLEQNGVRVVRFEDDKMAPGQEAVVDQWIAAHARHFIGTHVSTFSYRIHEDREILGFDPKTTFNDLCPDDDINCEQPAKWTIKYQLDPYWHKDEF